MLVEVFYHAAGYALLVLGVGVMDDKLPARRLMPQLPDILVLQHFEAMFGCGSKQKAEEALRAPTGLPDNRTEGQEQAEVGREKQQLKKRGA